MVSRPLPSRHEVAIVRQFLSGAEHAALLDWANDQFATGQLNANKSGPGRYFLRYAEGDRRVPSVSDEIRARAIATFGVREYEEEPRFRCFLGCNTEGGYVHEHVDSEPEGRQHLRLNILLSRPVAGGLPIAGGRTLDVDERDLWCFYPAALRHASTPVEGPRHRFVLSIGILIRA